MDLSGVELPVTVTGALSTALGFLAIYKDWVLLGIGIILGVILTAMLFKIMGDSKKAAITKSTNGRRSGGSAQSSGTRGSKYDAQGYHKRTRGRGAFSDTERRQLDREMYDYLTKTGRIKERDDWLRTRKSSLARG